MEGSFEQIMTLLKELTSHKETNPNGNLVNNNPVDNPEVIVEEPVVQSHEEDPDKVVMVTSKSHPDITDHDEKLLNKMEMLAEKVRAMQGMEAYGRLDMQDFCLFPDMEIPAKFKVPDFEKFEGKTDPMVHLTMYTRSMAAYHKNEKLMVHCFQHSLAGGALTWFLHLDKGQIRSWRNLAELFVKQYQFVTDIAPDRFELQRMKKADKETFREYAQRWREKASQVQPPLSEKEIVRLFVKTLDGAYFEKLLGCVTNRFSDVVIAGEQVEDVIREGRLNGSKKPFFQKKDGDVHIAHAEPHQLKPCPTSPFNTYPHQSHTPLHVNNISFGRPSTNNSPNVSQNQYERERIKIDPVLIAYEAIYDALLKQNLIGPEIPRPTPNPLPKWYNANETCKYHMDSPGHSIERCISFKIRVQKLRDIEKLVFEDEENPQAGPNIGNNQLPHHTV